MQQTTTVPVESGEHDAEQMRRNQAVIDLLNSWENDDPEEQAETWTYLKWALDEERLSYRKLFAQE